MGEIALDEFGRIKFDTKLQSTEFIKDIIGKDQYITDEEIQLNIGGKLTSVNITPLI